MSNRQSGQESSLTDSDVCPVCGGSGYILTEIDGILYADQCECLKQKIDENRLRFANLPPAFADYELKSFKLGVYRRPESREIISAACKTIKVYLDKFDQMESAGLGLYLYSDTKGSGKTRMAASIANELLRQGKQVKFATSTNILKEIKDTWRNDSKYSESRLLDQLAIADILVIDDFGTEKPADWINDKFYHIINERYIGKKVTIFTSNMAIDRLDYDDRITNRIKERTYSIAFPEESVRELIAQNNAVEMVRDISRRGDRHEEKTGSER